MNPLLHQIREFVKTCTDDELRRLLAEVAQQAIPRLREELPIAIRNEKGIALASIIPEVGSFKLTRDEFIAEAEQRMNDPNSKLISAEELIRRIEMNSVADDTEQHQPAVSSIR